ncbi:hypothetical protein Q3G72_027206 [Acer saccharum]|nr:hypothetical protein Q3G72_027206 [Acer saccharum]
MDREHLRQQIATMRQSMFDEGILDQYFIQLEQLERDGIPDFAEDLTAVYFRDTSQRLAFVEEEMEKTSYDFEKVERRLYQLKGSSASIGAIRVINAVKQALQFFHEGNIEG